MLSCRSTYFKVGLEYTNCSCAGENVEFDAVGTAGISGAGAGADIGAGTGAGTGAVAAGTWGK